MAITIQQIAELAGVSRGTVDRAINNRGRINPEVAEKILRIANENGYFAAKRNGGISKKIGVITQLNTSQFMIHVKEGIETGVKELKERNVQVFVEGTDSVDANKQAALIDEMIKKDIDGLAIMPSDSEIIRRKIREVKALGIPVTTFNSDLEGSERDFFIGLDNARSGKTAAGLMGMLTGGEGRILIITGHFTNDVNSQRVAGFVDEMKATYPKTEILGVQSSFDKAEEVEKIIESTIENVTDLDGIFIVSSGQEGVEKAFKKLNLKKRPYVIVYDRTPDNEKALKNNSVDFVIGQEGYRQGYTAPVKMANYLISGEKPKSEYEYTDIIIITKYNI